MYIDVVSLTSVFSKTKYMRSLGYDSCTLDDQEYMDPHNYVS